jgi:hypothetical protein
MPAFVGALWSSHLGVISRAMRNTDDITRALRLIELELIELELAARLRVPTAADHARALLHEVLRIARVASRSAD